MSDTDAPFVTGKSPVLAIRLMWAFRFVVTTLVMLTLWVVSGQLAKIDAMQQSLSELKQDVRVMQAEQRMRDLRGSK